MDEVAKHDSSSIIEIVALTLEDVTCSIRCFTEYFFDVVRSIAKGRII